MSLIYLISVLIAVGVAEKWPDPETDPLVFIANPIEAEMPGHWVPLSIAKKILERSTPLTTTTPKPNKNYEKLKATKKPVAPEIEKPQEVPEDPKPETEPESEEQETEPEEPEPETEEPESQEPATEEPESEEPESQEPTTEEPESEEPESTTKKKRSSDGHYNAPN